MEFPVTINHEDIVLKLFNWMDYSKDQATRNVEACDKNGNCLWVIDNKCKFWNKKAPEGWDPIHQMKEAFDYIPRIEKD